MTASGNESASSLSAASRGSALGPSRGSRADRAICAFWIGDRCFGLDIGVVGEVVEVADVTEVPLAPPELVGIFNLRGAPMPIVDLSSALGAGGSRGAARLALVLRTESMALALTIDRMDGVVPAGRGTATEAAEEGESPLVEAFVEVPGRAGVVTAISARALLEHLDRLRFTRAEG